MADTTETVPDVRERIEKCIQAAISASARNKALADELQQLLEHDHAETKSDEVIDIN